MRFPDRNQVEAEIVGFDPNEDVALLRIDPEGPRPARRSSSGTSGELQVGAPVAAIGSPFGEEGSLSVGVISALDRTLESLTKFSISGAIQTDAAINHGNSGGPLVDAAGRVLGINSQINAPRGDGSGVGFAIPIDSVKRSLDELRAKGKVDYAYLGVSSSSLYPQLAERLGLPIDHGAIVAQVVAGGPADKAGLKAGEDDAALPGRRRAPRRRHHHRRSTATTCGSTTTSAGSSRPTTRATRSSSRSTAARTSATVTVKLGSRPA